MPITDNMIDRFFGEYEAPDYYHGAHMTCWNCSSDILEGEEYSRLPYWDENAGEVICAECAHRSEVLQSVFNALSDSEKLELLGMEMEVYDG